MYKNTFNHHSSSGFTLLESLVVIVFIGILSAIALPNWLAFVDIQRLNTAQDEVYQAMRQAQSQAIKQKSTWQISLREQNNVVQWAVHPADAEKFIPDAVSANDHLWHNLEQNIRIDQQTNNKGKYETTFSKQTSPLIWRLMFNYQGCPVYKVGNECTQTSLRTLGQITFKSQNGGKDRRCIYMSTVLGAIRTGKDHAKANKNNKYCY
ncbi:pilus assembly FimT family protein [Iningainema tapete]|uniref:Type II secretion system protein n=1 Tax=Iningainema tapete BLCC-T55 TaxID=2748662 RepID=A0A8J7C937_9CYAN|nr:type II secretion system protein [Iningainema tapete]MBD2777644.1 type II secretion system protein [Iningainema tapete BLCC-T55]